MDLVPDGFFHGARLGALMGQLPTIWDSLARRPQQDAQEERDPQRQHGRFLGRCFHSNLPSGLGGCK